VNDDRPPVPDRVTHALRDLPRAAASPTFTDRVLAGATARAGEALPARRARRAALPALVTALAAAAVVVAVRTRAPVSGTEHHDLRTLGAELEQLRREQQDLAAELQNLRAQGGGEAAPVIYVGQSEGVDLVLDLVHFEKHFRPPGPEGKP
jgi:hypothetical protein